MIKVGILGAAGYTGGELIRLLLNHPEADIVFANSESNAGNLVSDVHEGLIGETNLKFTERLQPVTDRMSVTNLHLISEGCQKQKLLTAAIAV